VVENRAALSADALALLDAEVAGHRTLAEVVRWGLDRRPPLVVEDVVIQDEFTHDVVMPWRDGLHLVYDTT
jgi:hypothetical protein